MSKLQPLISYLKHLIVTNKRETNTCVLIFLNN